jgi:hypothetical protein
MAVIWGVHNNSDVFIDVGIIDASTGGLTPEPSGLPHIGNIAAPQLFRALIDTGAQATMISPNVINTLGLSPVGKILISGVGPQAHYHNGYLFQVAFVIPVLPPGQAPAPGASIPALIHVNRNVIYGAEITSTGGRFDVLLGMDILSSGTLIVQGNGTYTWSL